MDQELSLNSSRLRIFIHVGFHKTGTSTFQACLQLNRQLFPTDFIAFAPTMGNMRPVINAVLAAHSKPSSTAWEAVAARLSELRQTCIMQNKTTVLISTENLLGVMPNADNQKALYPNSRSIMETIARTFSSDDVTVIFSKREKHAWIRSLYKHQVAHRGLVEDFEQFCARPKFRNFELDQEIDQSTNFASGRMQVRLYNMEDDLHRNTWPGSSIMDIIDPTDKMTQSWSTPPISNRGLTDQELEYISKFPRILLPKAIRKWIARKILNS